MEKTASVEECPLDWPSVPLSVLSLSILPFAGFQYMIPEAITVNIIVLIISPVDSSNSFSSCFIAPAFRFIFTQTYSQLLLGKFMCGNLILLSSCVYVFFIAWPELPQMMTLFNHSTHWTFLHGKRDFQSTTI